MKTPFRLDGNNLYLPLLIFFGLPALLVGIRLSGTSIGEILNDHLSFNATPEAIRHKLNHVLFVPLGAVVVVFVRLTLGLKLLGPYRSLLLAVAFQVAGIVFGLTVLILSILTVYSTRSIIRSFKMPYFGSSLMSLSTIALLMVFVVIACQWVHIEGLQSIAYFPMVVLCLIADAYLRAAKQDGTAVAISRGLVTALVAAVLSIISSVELLHDMAVHFPELLLAQMGLIVIVAKYMNWKLFSPSKAGDEEDETSSKPASETDFVQLIRSYGIPAAPIGNQLGPAKSGWSTQSYKPGISRSGSGGKRWYALSKSAAKSGGFQRLNRKSPHRPGVGQQRRLSVTR